MLIAHLSDPHVRAQGQLYQGLVDSNAMFDQAIRTLNALRPEPDIVIIGGDLVDDGQPAAYDAVQQALSGLRQPIYAIPGNHDDRAAFGACFGGSDAPTGQRPLHFDTGVSGPVRVLGLDITVPGEHHGDMDDAACRWLSDRLAEHPQTPTMVLMHQPSVDTGMSYIDAYHCRRGVRLSEIVQRHPNVERILCGHIHRSMQMRFGGTLLMSAPSTTTAIALRLEDGAEPASFIEPPAFLLHHWTPGTGLITHWVPVGNFPGPLPFF
ncbi:hypothetical protein P775_26585 [Puniceibacterium antarcticum]|uniref:Calcineurin-like phosphoesterase domain-containing protein n=1 Tax=Puniceibacterium antarcticum TaxID=1206336 RepID=A0A2G8R030_9RHOB|nr:phosphodiesterase [Puniceibacterium antarcticum]PIL14873.1 hypothetical protein P775_26585 [Puniceibacterium antarcticum]